MEIKTNLVIGIGRYSNYKNEIKKLAAIHYKEVPMPGGEHLSIDIDDDFYTALEKMNRHIGFGIWEDKKLIGYLSIFIFSHHQHQTQLFAHTDGFFVLKEKRGFRTAKAVIEMFKLAETILKNKYGVNYMYLGTNYINDLKLLADKLDYRPASIMYLKRL